MKLNVVDLFVGCGGLTDGFLQTKKYKTLVAVDWELRAIETLRNRLSTKWGYKSVEDNILHFDMQKIEELLNGYNDEVYGESKGLTKLVGSKKVDVIIGGPPCQAYSIAGRVRDKNGMREDYRNYLFESYVKIVDHFKPQSFVFENVQGILSAKPGGVDITKRIRKAFKEIGYEITGDLKENAVFDLSYYNVPQKRKRVIIYGVEKSKTSSKQIIDFYKRVKGAARKNPLIAKKALDNLPKIYPLKEGHKRGLSHSLKMNGVELPSNHEPRFHSKRDIQIFRTLALDIETGKNKYITIKALINLYKEKTGKDSNVHKYHVIRWDKPSNTIPAHLYKDGLRHIHPDPKQARSITVREAARLQTFDDDFEFLGSKGDQYKMIGNAVPPQFAKTLGNIVYDLHLEYANV